MNRYRSSGGSDLTEKEVSLRDAVKQKKFDVVKKLLQEGVNPNCSGRRPKKTTPLCFAAARGFVEIAKLLIDYGANANLRFDSSPIFLAAQYNRPKIVELLCNSGANVNMQRDDGNTPLQMAILAGNTEVVRVLLECNANPSMFSGRSSPPIYRASMLGHEEIVRMLLAKGAHINVRSRLRDPELGIVPGYTPLVAALRRGHIRVCHLLINAGANPDVTITTCPYQYGSPVTHVEVPAVKHLAISATSLIHCQGFKHLLFDGGIRDVKVAAEAKRELMYYSRTPGGFGGEMGIQIPQVIVAIINEAEKCLQAQRYLTPRLLNALAMRIPQAIVRMILGTTHGQSFLVNRCVWTCQPQWTDVRQTKMLMAKEKFLSDMKSLVGRRVKVRWNGGRHVYGGVIQQYCESTRKHTVTYDDGDVRQYDLDGLICYGGRAGRFELEPEDQRGQ